MLAMVAGCGGGVDGGGGTEKAEDGASCEDDSACSSGQCILMPQGGVCAAPCFGVDDCREGFNCSVAESATKEALVGACVSRPSSGAAAGALCREDDDCQTGLCSGRVCTQLCGSCPSPAMCFDSTVERGGLRQEFGLCQWLLAVPDVEFEGVETSSRGSDLLEFEVPEGIVSFTVIVHDDDGSRVGVRRLRGPDGVAVVDLDDGEVDLNPGRPYIGTASVLVPNHDQASRPAPGTWRLQVGTYEPERFDALVPVSGVIERVSIVFRRVGSGPPFIDLSIGIAVGLSITASTAAEDPFVQAVHAELDKLLFEPLGLRRGTVDYISLPSAHDTVEDGDEVREMCRMYARPGPYGVSVNLFIVPRLSFTAGFSGGIPGPAGLYDSNASCVVLESLRNGQATGVLASHELGHFLGLFHTTELDGSVDPIGDTPSCPGGTAVERCPDYTNLMFPRFPLNRDLSLTEGQRQVLLRSPFVYRLD